MLTPHKIFLEGLGNVLLIKKHGIKKLNFHFREANNIYVYIPANLTFAEAANILLHNREHLVNSVKRYKERVEKKEVRKLVVDDIPTLCSRALEYIPARVATLAAKHNLSYSSVRIGVAKSTWGTCSAQNRITISIFTMLLPPHLVDFVILHELTHTIFKNHGTMFHDYLNHLCDGREKELNKEMKLYKVIS